MSAAMLKVILPMLGIKEEQLPDLSALVAELQEIPPALARIEANQARIITHLGMVPGAETGE